MVPANVDGLSEHLVGRGWLTDNALCGSDDGLDGLTHRRCCRTGVALSQLKVDAAVIAGACVPLSLESMIPAGAPNDGKG